jgi:hypothetical protein
MISLVLLFRKPGVTTEVAALGLATQLVESKIMVNSWHIAIACTSTDLS